MDREVASRKRTTSTSGAQHGAAHDSVSINGHQSPRAAQQPLQDVERDGHLPRSEATGSAFKTPDNPCDDGVAARRSESLDVQDTLGELDLHQALRLLQEAAAESDTGGSCWAAIDAARAEWSRKQEEGAVEAAAAAIVAEAAAKAAAEAAAEAVRVEAAKVEAVRAKVEAVRAEAAKAAAAREAAYVQLERSAAIRRLSARTACEACNAVVAGSMVRAAEEFILRELIFHASHAGKSGARSAAAKKRRRAVSKPPPAPAESVPIGTVNQPNQSVQRELTEQRRLLKLARKQLKRANNTSAQRGQQLKQRDSKQQQRKAQVQLQRGIDGAARRDAERTRKRKQPPGEPLHSGERKHQRLLGKGTGSGGGRDGGRGSGGKGHGTGGGGGNGHGKGGGGRGRGKGGRGGKGGGGGKGQGGVGNGHGWGGFSNGGKGRGGHGNWQP
jgi:hypothetical protein